ncbi:MAG: hypothetical protein OXE50_16505, partial [Chloroflexi bacterium]|nr:hypothetical protein [Chloroflexota bacterium]
MRFKSIVLTADEVEYNEATGDLKAGGNVHYRTLDGDQDLRAERLAYNLQTELGTFYEARGRAAAASQGGPRLLTTDNPFQFEARLGVKAGEASTVSGGPLANC